MRRGVAVPVLSAGLGASSLVAPNLFGVVGRKAGSVARFDYSDGMKASGITWDATNDDQFLSGRGAMVKNTKMTLGPMSPEDHKAVVDYLQTLK